MFEERSAPYIARPHLPGSCTAHNDRNAFQRQPARPQDDRAVARSLAGRKRRRLPLPPARRVFLRRGEAGSLSQARRGRREAHYGLGGDLRRARGDGAAAQALLARAPAVLDRRQVRPGNAAFPAAARRGARGQGLHLPVPGKRSRLDRGRGAAPGQGIGAPRRDPVEAVRPRRGAMALHQVRRFPAQRRLRIQRRSDGELRPRRRSRRRPGRGDLHHADRRRGNDRRRPLHGFFRLPRRQERTRGLRPRNRGGGGRAALHARNRGGGAHPPLPDQGRQGRTGPRDRAGDHEVSGAGGWR